MGAGSRPADPPVVYYAAEDYAGFWRRMVIDLVGMSSVFQEIEPLDAPGGVGPSTGGVR